MTGWKQERISKEKYYSRECEEGRRISIRVSDGSVVVEQISKGINDCGNTIYENNYFVINLEGDKPVICDAGREIY